VALFPTSLVAKSGKPLSYIISRRRRHDPIGHVVAGELRCIVGYVRLGRAIFPRLTVEENPLMGLATWPGKTPIPPRILKKFPVLKEMPHRRGGDLSGGQQQQFAIGRAIRMLAQTGEIAILLVEQYHDFAELLADNYLPTERGEFMPQDGVKAALAV
jgi:urea transport system ATP-binding protein